MILIHVESSILHRISLLGASYVLYFVLEFKECFVFVFEIIMPVDTNAKKKYFISVTLQFTDLQKHIAIMVLLSCCWMHLFFNNYLTDFNLELQSESYRSPTFDKIFKRISLPKSCISFYLSYLSKQSLYAWDAHECYIVLLSESFFNFYIIFIRHGSITENTIEMLIFCDSPFIYHFGSNILRVNAEVRGGISVPGKEKQDMY